MSQVSHPHPSLCRKDSLPQGITSTDDRRLILRVQLHTAAAVKKSSAQLIVLHDGSFERWLVICMVVLITDIAPTGDSKRPKRYFPFAEGPRSCVGQSLAKVSLVATMATLLQHFHFCLADEVNACRGGRYYLAEQSVIQSRGAAARLHHIFYNVKADSCSHESVWRWHGCIPAVAAAQHFRSCAARRWVVPRA
jgi:hypothetical protein